MDSHVQLALSKNAHVTIAAGKGGAKVSLLKGLRPHDRGRLKWARTFN